MRRVLAIGAHPDDIEIGCGGSLIAHADMGDEVWMFVATKGEHGPGDVSARVREQLAAASVMGVPAERVVWGEGLPDAKIQLFQYELVQQLEALTRDSGPFDIVYTHHADDSHQDHVTVATNTGGAFRNAPTILAYRSPSTLDFPGRAFRDITEQFDRKRKALDCHASQVASSLAVDIDVMDGESRAAGRQARGGVPRAEAFFVYRERLL